MRRMIRQVSEDVQWSQIVAKAWCDNGVMKRLFSDPRAVLAEHDLEYPDDMDIQVVPGTEVKMEADSDTERRFYLNVEPPEELTDEDLVGGAVAWCGCAACRRCGSAVCGRCGACGCRCWW
jgi:hypothetical protein